jgi:3-hydroxybutyryl-CoA dehydrogenase
VAEKVERGELGRKTGKGWYEYDARGNRVAAAARREEMA